MSFVKLLSVFLCVLSVCTLAASQACPSTGIACYPGDCCGHFQQCVGSQFYPAQATAPGTVCMAGSIVMSYDCPTTCGTGVQASSPTVAPFAPTTPPTRAPTPAPTQPTQAPPSQATTKPTTVPIPPTPVPTQPPTPAPTQPPTQAPTQPANSGCCNLADVFSEDDFNTLFPHANGGALAGLANQHAIFNYSYLLAAAQNFPEFACTGTPTQRKQEVAAFLAITSQETSGWWSGQPYNWGYYFSTEMGCTDATCTQYCDSSNSQYPCQSGMGYYGRGPIQLSWNYNYGQASQALFGNSKLLTNPDMVFDNAGTGFMTALWFWMTPQSPKPACHDVMVGNFVPSAADMAANRYPGFGLTIDIVNGGIECGYTTQQATNRIAYYTTYVNHFGVPTGSYVSCANMASY